MDDPTASLGPSAPVRATVILAVVLTGMATSVLTLLPVGFGQRLIAVVVGIGLGFGMLQTASRIPSGIWSSRVGWRTVVTSQPGGEFVRLLTAVVVVVGSVLISRFAVAPDAFNQRAISLGTGIALGFGVLKLASRITPSARIIDEIPAPPSVQAPTAPTTPISPPAPAVPPAPLPPHSPDPQAPPLPPPDLSFPGSLQR